MEEELTRAKKQEKKRSANRERVKETFQILFTSRSPSESILKEGHLRRVI